MIDIRKVDLNLLLAFHALMEARSVTGAAHRLGVGQPAMSHALGRLRVLLQDPLLVRSGSVMRPTARALSLAAPVAAILQEIRQTILASPNFSPDQDERIFRVGAPDYVIAALFPRLLARIATAAPRSRVAVHTVTRDDVTARLNDGMIDLAVGYYPDADPDLVRETLFHEEHVCLFDAAACTLTSPIGLDDFLALPHFLVSLRHDFSGAVDKHLAEIGLQRFVQFSCASFLAIPLLLKGARALASLPSRLATHCLAAMDLTISPLPLPVQGFDIFMVWHSRSGNDAAQTWFRDQMRAAAEA